MTIQIDQRINRCARCGKMLQESADVIVGEGRGRDRQLFCTQRCADELAAMTAAAAAPQAGGATR